MPLPKAFDHALAEFILAVRAAAPQDDTASAARLAELEACHAKLRALAADGRLFASPRPARPRPAVPPQAAPVA